MLTLDDDALTPSAARWHLQLIPIRISFLLERGPHGGTDPARARLADTAAKKHSLVMHTAIGVSIATGIRQGELQAQPREHADKLVNLLPLLCLTGQCGRA